MSEMRNVANNKRPEKLNSSSWKNDTPVSIN